MNMENLIAVQNDGEGVLGKLLYFSLGNVLIDKETFNQIGLDMDLPNLSSDFDMLRLQAQELRVRMNRLADCA